MFCVQFKEFEIRKNTMKIIDYKNLDVWKQSYQLVTEIYRVTQDFPNTETFGLTQQMKRASISVISNTRYA